MAAHGGAAPSFVGPACTALGSGKAFVDRLASPAMQVGHDQALLRERIERLTGAAGVALLEESLAAARAAVEEAGDWEVASERWVTAAQHAQHQLGAGHLPSAGRAHTHTPSTR